MTIFQVELMAADDGLPPSMVAPLWPFRGDVELVAYIRTVCADQFNLAYDHPFFAFNEGLEGEHDDDIDEMLVTIFLDQYPHHQNAYETVLVLCHG